MAMLRMLCQSRQSSATTQTIANLPSTSGRTYLQSLLRPHVGNAADCKRRERKAASTAAVATGQLVAFLDLQPNTIALNEDEQGGIATTKRVTRGSAVVSIPASQWVSASTVAKSEVGRFVEHLPPWVQVALFILYEKSRSRSQWRPYLESLPMQLDSPLLWNEDELESLLKGTQLLDTVYGYRQFFSSKFAELEETVFAQNPDVFDPATFSENAFLWAAVVLRARVHPPLDGNNLSLIPLADKVAHQRGPGVSWKVTSGGFGRGERALVLEAQRDFNANEPVVMDFGPDKLDSEIFLNHGVMDDFVTRAGFTLNLALPEDDRFFDDKADIVDINGLSESQEFILTTDREPIVDMLAYLRLINLSGADAFLLESLFRNDAWGYLQKPVSLENETAVFSSMIDGCRDALNGYVGSLSEDKAALRSAAEGSKQEKALRIRIGEREALDSTLQFFEARIDRLERLEYYQERRLKGLGLLDEDGRSTFDDFFKDGIA